MRKKRTAKVDITGYSSRGHGVGVDENSQLFEVPLTLEGEQAVVSYQRKRKGKYIGHVEEWIKTRSGRSKPPCPHFSYCGGCTWQHMSYSEQLEEKSRRIKELFFPLSDEIRFRPIFPCDPPWAYRNKMEYSFSSDQKGNHYLGLFMRNCRGKVFNVESCPLVRDWMPSTLKEVRLWWNQSTLDAFHPYRNSGSLRTLTLREGLKSENRMVILTVSGRPEYALSKRDISSFVLSVKRANPNVQLSIFLSVQQAIKGVPTQFYEMHLSGPEWIEEVLQLHGQPYSFQISPSAFFQPNSMQAEKLYEQVIDLARIGPESVVYDLYCGTGTLGICVGSKAKQVIGIELSPEACIDARANVARNKLENVQIYSGDVAKILKNKQVELPAADVVLVDPPRMGLSQDAIEQLLLLEAETIVYVSCNPSTQVEDCKLLMEGGYDVKVIQPVDQFPQTVHCECISLLKRR